MLNLGVNVNTAQRLASTSSLLEAIRSKYSFQTAQEQHLSHPTRNAGKWYPLHVAAALGDMPTLKLLLKQGYSLELRDDLNLTPLQVAAASGQAEVVSFLISKGANVFAVDGYKFNLSALDLAIMESRASVVKVLINEGHVLDRASTAHLATVYNMAFGIAWELAPNPAAIKAFDAALKTFVVIIETRNLALLEFSVTDSDNKNSTDITGMPATILMEIMASQVTSKVQYDSILAAIHKINVNDSCYQTYLDAKALFHVLPVHGNYKLTYHKADGSIYMSKISAEGHWGSFTTPMALFTIEDYLHNKLASEGVTPAGAAFESIAEVYKSAALFSKESGVFSHAQEAYDLYKQGKTVLLPSGWDGHFVNIIFDPVHEYFIVGNDGQRYQSLPSGSNVYKIYNSANITPELMYSILNNKEQIDLELAFKYQLALDKVDNLWQPNQTHGNCAWQSHEAAIEGLLYVNFLNQGYNNAVAKSMAHTHYLAWDAYHTLANLKNYFDHDPSLGIEAIRDILFVNHPTLFSGTLKMLDPVIDPREYAQAQYIVTVLTHDPYKKDVNRVFGEIFKKARPELLTLFKASGFDVKQVDNLDDMDNSNSSNNLNISEVLDNHHDPVLQENGTHFGPRLEFDPIMASTLPMWHG